MLGGKKLTKTGSKKIVYEPAPKAKKKKNVKEIDGVMWLLDDAGNPLKRVRKKGAGKDGDDDAPVPATATATAMTNGRSRSPTPRSPPPGKNPSLPKAGNKKPKKNVVEIDGQLYLLDENGNPAKKIRKKGEKMQRTKSTGRMQDPEGRGRSAMNQVEDRRRAKSLGPGMIGSHRNTPEAVPGERKEFLDDKGRRVIIEADGSKTVIDKNGKRLRPKKKKVDTKPAPMEISDDDSVLFGGNGLNDNFLDAMPKSSISESGMFDKLWDDGPATVVPNKSSSSNNVTNDSHTENDPDGAKAAADAAAEAAVQESMSLSAQISEFGKENRELSLKLLTAEEQIQELTEQNKREKAKNVKAMTEMMQLKADYTETSSELQKLKTRIKDLTSTLDARENEIRTLKETISTNAANAAAATAAAVAQVQKEQTVPVIPHKPPMAAGNGNAASCPSCGAENKEVEELFAENRALQRKIEFERTKAQQDLKKKEDQLAFITKENTAIRDEIELICRGEVGNLAVNPTFIRMIDEKKRLQAELEQEKEVATIRIESMQQEIENLERINRDLKKSLGQGNLADDGSIDLGLSGGSIHESSKTNKEKTGAGTAAAARPKDLNKHIGEIQVNFNKSFGQLGGPDAHQSSSWFGFGKK